MKYPIGFQMRTMTDNLKDPNRYVTGTIVRVDNNGDYRINFVYVPHSPDRGNITLSEKNIDSWLERDWWIVNKPALLDDSLFEV